MGEWQNRDVLRHAGGAVLHNLLSILPGANLNPHLKDPEPVQIESGSVIQLPIFCASPPQPYISLEWPNISIGFM